ncbi:hypothetical protein [Gillisia limnaea]|uniref:Membrane protein n=1 Tax=Gillisia limnaea (strain DSM 15749 / LMG 21470 / R-8282) TaxID=865937 RepID=H2BV55_GILLR|nr:hypothetical protein [Gillisia limnaea]EHQ03945.1 membrane protein [Gillisia limnaea DSM 15749]
MDELEILKKDWKKQGENYPRLSYEEISKMIWKRSSSIVKWIFVISILEFLFWAILNIFLADEAYWKEMELINLKEFTIVVYIVGYAITFYFIWQFYRNYIKISSTDDSATLMKNILKTRKTVKYYIGYVIISTAVTSLVYLYFTFNYHIKNAVPEEAASYEFDFNQWLLFIGMTTIVILIFLGIIWLFYRLLYGILLKRLSKNYKELMKLQV